MNRLRRIVLIVLESCLLIILLAPALLTDEAEKGEAEPLIRVERNGGFVPHRNAFYEFSVTKDGKWQFVPALMTAGESKTGTMPAKELEKWVQELEKAGLARMKSNEKLGRLDEAFMIITVQFKDRKVRVKARLEEKIPTAIDNKVMDIVKPE